MAPSDELVARIVGLDPERRPALVQRLYRERGWRVADDDVPDGWTGLRVVSPAGRRRRLLVATDAAAASPDLSATDRVVRPGDTERGDDTDARVVDAAALAEQVRYALAPDAQRRLARTVFDTDRSTLLDEPERTREPPERTRASPTSPGESAPSSESPRAGESPHTGASSNVGALSGPPASRADEPTGERPPGATDEPAASPDAGGETRGAWTRRRWVAFGGVLFVGVAVIALVGGGVLPGTGVDGGRDAVPVPAFDPGGPPENRGVSGLTPTPGNVAPGPDAESRDEGGGETGANATTRTATPGDTTTPTEGRLPGVDADGSVDETVLAERTAAVLANRSYRFVAVYRERVDGVTTARLREVARVENDSRYVSTVSRLGDPVGSPQVIADTTVDARDGRVVRRAVGDGVVRREEPTTGDPFRPRVAQYVEWYLGVESSAVVDTERRDGHRHHLLRLRGDPWPGVENTTGSAVVTDAGLVRSVTRRYTLPGRPNVTATVAVRVTEIGETTVDPESNGTSENRSTSENRDTRGTRDTRGQRTRHPLQSAAVSQFHRSVQSSQSHHSTRYVHRSPPSLRQVAPTSVVSA